MMPTEIHSCKNMFPSRYHLSDTHLLLLVLAYSASAIIIFVSNCCVIYGLTKTRQMTTISQKLLVILSVCDSAIGSLVLPATVVLFTRFSRKTNCTYEWFAQLLANFFIHSSGFLIATISLDRYFHMRWLNVYKKCMGTKVMSCLVVADFVLAGIISSGTVIASKHDVAFQYNIPVLFIEVVCMMTILVLYISALRTVRKHMRHISGLSQTSLNNQLPRRDMKMAATVLLILVTVFICYIPFLVVTFVYGYLFYIVNTRTSTLLDSLPMWFLLLMALNSSFNAFILISRNKPLKSLLYFKHLCTQNIKEGQEESSSSSSRSANGLVLKNVTAM